MKKSNKQGFTLIEILVGIALFGIITISLIPVFTYGYMHIYRSGDKTEALYDIHKTIESDGAINPNKQTVTITFDNKDIDVSINVFQTEKQYDKFGNKASIIYFEANLDEF